MADTLSRAERSFRMSLVRGSGNKQTELKLAPILKEHRLSGWRRKARVYGCPDFVWTKYRVAVFVDGCFWHSCPRHARIPKSRQQFWVPKLERNRLRDVEVTRALRKTGWSVIRIWECELGGRSLDRKLRRIHLLIGGDMASFE